MSNSGLSKNIKTEHMEQLANYRREVLYKTPKLRSLFFEVTSLCNEHCLHCGSRCGEPEVSTVPSMTKADWMRMIDEVAEDFEDKPMLCVTGGEPLLYPDLYEVMSYAVEKRFCWGMTSNGTLITEAVAEKLAKAGMSTISVSVDGLRDTHEWFRQSPGSFEKTIAGIQNLLASNAFQHVQVTTVVHQRNYGELEELYQMMRSLKIKSWRVINIEPIGRAKDNRELALSDEQYRSLMNFINTHRFLDPKMQVTFGCSHYLGTDLEREVRPWYFLCNAGVYTASIQSNGNIGACLDIERRPELVEGNVHRDRLSTIWKEGFAIYRGDYRKKGKCAECKDYEFCAGDSFHTWDFDRQEPSLCMKEILNQEGNK